MDDYRSGIQTAQGVGAQAATRGAHPATVTRNGPFLHSRWHSLRAAWAGVRYTLRTQRNAQIEAAAAVVIFGAAWLFGLSSVEWALLALTVFLIFALEAVNTAVEAAVDLVSPEVHPLAGIAKDAAAGALVLAIVGAILVAAAVFGPRVVGLFR